MGFLPDESCIAKRFPLVEKVQKMAFAWEE